MSKLKLVKVMFSNPKYNYDTFIAANNTESSAKDYFVSTVFNLGVANEDNLQECVDIEFDSNEDSEGSDKCECLSPTFTLSRGETLRTCTYCHKLIEH